MSTETSNISRHADPNLTIADIARRLNMSETFVYRQATTGKLNCYHIGGTVRKRGAIRFSENQFQQYLSSQLDSHCPVYPMEVKSCGASDCTARPNTVSQRLNRLLRKKSA